MESENINVSYIFATKTFRFHHLLNEYGKHNTVHHTVVVASFFSDKLFIHSLYAAC